MESESKTSPVEAKRRDAADGEKEAGESRLPSAADVKKIMDIGQPTILAIDFDHDNSEFKETIQKLEEMGQDVFDIFEDFSHCQEVYQKLYDEEISTRKKMSKVVSELSIKRENLATFRKLKSEIDFKTKSMKTEIKRIEKQCAGVERVGTKLESQVHELKEDIAAHQKILDAGPGLTNEQKKVLASKEEELEELRSSLSGNVQMLTNLRNKTHEQRGRIAHETEIKIQAEATIKKVTEQIKSCKIERDHAQKKKLRLEGQLRELRVKVEECQADVDRHVKDIRTVKSETEARTKQLRGKEKRIASFIKEYDALYHEIRAHVDRTLEMTHTNELLTNNNARREKTTQSRRREAKRLAAEVQKIRKMTELTKKRICKQEKLIEKYAERRAKTEAQMRDVQMQRVADEKMLDGLKRSIDKERREREFVNSNLVKSEDEIRALFDELKVAENTKKNIGNELKNFQGITKRQRNEIEQLDAEGEKFEVACTKANQRYYTALEDVKLREEKITDLQKQIVETEASLKKKQSMYEAVRSERNLYSKVLIESQEGIAKMRREFSLVSHQIEQYKEEIHAKDGDLRRELMEHERVQKDIEALQTEHTRIKKQIQSSDQIASTQKREIQKLSKIISEANAEYVRQQRELETIVNERDALGYQLIQRNGELSKLYERIKIQRSALYSGESAYEKQKASRNALTDTIKESQRKLKGLEHDVENLEELKRQKKRLERELFHEKAKVSALTKEMERPMNVHRWRKLAGSEPRRFSAIQKIQRLQKLLISKTEEGAAKDKLIDEQETLYVELKNILARQPGLEMVDHLAMYEENIKDKRKQLMRMGNELEIYRHQVKDLKDHISLHNEAMRDLENQYMDRMRRRRAEALAADVGIDEVDGTSRYGL